MYMTQHGHSALHICCKDGKVAAVKVLIDNGAHLCCRDKVSAYSMYENFRKLLVFVSSTCCSFLTQMEQDGNTALYYACIGGFEDIATLLIQSGADVHSVNKASLAAWLLCLQSFQPRRILSYRR